MIRTEGGKPLEMPNPAVQLIRDLPKGTRIRAHCKDEVLEGDISSINGATSRCTGKALVELVNTIWLNAPSNAVDNWLGFSRLELNEIRSFQRIEMSTEQKESTVTRKEPTEICYASVEIKTEKAFSNLLKSTSELSDVALSFQGVNVGSIGKVGWIVLFVKQTIVLMDVVELVQVVPGFWEKIYSELLGNKDITKIVYNSRPIVDYMYFNHLVSLNNVFDCQVAEFSIQCKEWQNEGAKSNLVMYKSLSQCLEIYLPNETLPEEIKLLREFEEMDFSKSSPLMSRPVIDPKICKSVAINIKYLPSLKRELTKKMLDGFYQGVSAQMESMLREKRSVKEHFLSVPNSVPPAVIKVLAPFDDSDSVESEHRRLSR